VTSIAVFLFAIWLVVRYAPSAVKKTFEGKIHFGLMQLGQAALLIVAFGAFVYMFAQLPIVPVTLLVAMEALFISAIFFTLYKDFIMESMVVWKKRPEREDVIAVDLMKPSLISKYSIGRLVDTKQAKRMAKMKRKWPVLDLPMFLPFILIALVVYILFGNQVLMIS